ncbi:MAG: GNAT family N-acetyltransferase, partial [Arenicellales bacterium]
IKPILDNPDSQKTDIGFQSRLNVRSAEAVDLATINNIVIDAITNWKLSERVYRLARHSLTYTETDLEFMLALIGENNEGRAIAAALWEPVSGGKNKNSSILLHGIYVKSDYHGEGIGTYLVDYVSKRARKSGYDRMIVKAWRDAEEFFLRMGFYGSTNNEQERLYPRQLWRIV